MERNACVSHPTICIIYVLYYMVQTYIHHRKKRSTIFARKIALVNVALMHWVLASDSGQPYAGEWTKWFMRRIDEAIYRLTKHIKIELRI